MSSFLSFFVKTISVLLLLLVLFFGYFTIFDYSPDKIELISKNDKFSTLKLEDTLSVLCWNIGYAGLNKEMDFFYEGGKHVRPEKYKVLENLQKIKSYLKTKQNVDFFLMQEVDVKSKRSYYINIRDTLTSLFENYNNSFALNYDVDFVPLPIFKPMGMVQSGLLSIANFVEKSSDRYAFMDNFSWPNNIFMLDRCFMVNRYNLENGKELLIVNSHNSAYDDGTLRKKQIEYLTTFLDLELKNGNYVIVGADWNQCPTNFKPDYEYDIFDTKDFIKIPDNVLPEWKWVYSDKIPTNRRVNKPYDRGKTLTTTIDYFLVSPNIKTLEFSVEDLNFDFSDHNPVMIKIILK